MASRAAAGAAAVQASDFSKAITEYTAAIKELPNASPYYTARSTAYLRQTPPDLDSALHDAEYAITLAYKRGSKELIATAQMRRGIALFRSGRIAEASKVFEFVRVKGGGWIQGSSGQNEGSDASTTDYGRAGIKGVSGLEAWEIRCQNALKGKEEEAEKVEVQEIPKVQAPNIGGTAKSTAAPVSIASPVTKTATDAPKQSQTLAHNIRHDWYQSVTEVNISIYAKGIPPDATTVNFTPTSLSVSWPLETQGSDYVFELDPLFGQVKPTNSNFKVYGTKIGINLHKTQPGLKWHSLEASAVPTSISSREPSASATTTSPPAYPTSSKNGPKNWDTILKPTSKTENASDSKAGQSDVEADPTQLTEQDLDETEDGSDAAASFFKKLYRDADSDTRRAMMKSFQESNGTALSTNWKEVGSKKMETTPPDGMEARTWES
ncbi:MAG: hypothetical protein M1814_001705 [Vezdaea aestivalis]|nr:MAG: hypothetical protein M1814_001705 [Vezdaea aestivalis]